MVDLRIQLAQRFGPVRRLRDLVDRLLENFRLFSVCNIFDGSFVIQDLAISTADAPGTLTHENRGTIFFLPCGFKPLDFPGFLNLAPKFGPLMSRFESCLCQIPLCYFSDTSNAHIPPTNT